MISDRGMVALRSGAALAAALPGVQLRIGDGTTVLAEVRRPPFPDDGPPQLPACVFHRGVAKGHAQRQEGQQVGFMSLASGVDPAVEIVVAPGGRVLPGGIVRSPLLGMWVHTVPASHPPDRCRAVLDDLDLVDVACLHDEALDVTLLQAYGTAGDHDAADRVVEGLQTVLARLTVVDLEVLLGAEVGTSAPRTG